MASSGSPDDSLLAHAALLYYGDGLTQGEIARRMGVSRATIVGYLRQAREAQIVDIRIQGAPFTQSSLARDLAAQYALDDVYVIPGSGDIEDLTKRAARVAAMSLSFLLSPGDRLGVAWGRTMQHLAFQFPKAHIEDVTVFQLIGSMRSNRLFSAESCTIEIARRMQADCRTLHVPGIVSSAALAAELKAEPQIAAQFDAFGSLTKAIFSVGHVNGPDPHVVVAGITTPEELSDIAAKGAIGVVSGQFIDRDGQVMDCALHDRILSARPEELRRVPFRMMVAAGQDKLPACRAALKGGYCTHLVIDHDLATELTD